MENINDPAGTDRVTSVMKLRDSCAKSIPFLERVTPSEHSGERLTTSLCMQATCCVLGCSLKRFVLPAEKPTSTAQNRKLPLDSLLGSSGMRQRQHRGRGERSGFPDIADLPNFPCGCEWPCWESHSEQILQRLYDRFVKIANQIGSQRKEPPLTNGAEKACDKAISVLYTVTPWLVVKVRSVI